MSAPREETRGLPCWKICVYLCILFLMSDGSKNYVTMLVSIVCRVRVILWLDCQNTEKGRQEQRSSGAVHKKTDSGTRSRSDSISFSKSILLVSDGSKNCIALLASIVCCVLVILWLDCQNTEKGRQEQRLPGAVHKKTDSGTRSRSDSVSFVKILCRITSAIFPSF